MAIVLYQVKTSIDKQRDREFNRWYSARHCPDLLAFNGCVSARRYRFFQGDERYQYLAVYEFQDEATYERWAKSAHRKRMVAEYKAKFGPEIVASRAAYIQIWPA